MEAHPGSAMGHRSLFRRASKSCLGGFKKVFSARSDRHNDFLTISKTSAKSFKFSFKTSSLWKKSPPQEDERTCKPKLNHTHTTPEETPRIKDPELRRQAYPQGQSHLFRRLPPEIREQIYKEFWVACGVERHAFLEGGNMRYSPCVTDHEAPDERQLGLARDFRKAPQVQWHPEWFLRMQSPWCNHWRCEELWEDVKEGRKVDLNQGQNQAFMSLLVSCKRVYDESIDSFRESRILNITNGHTLQRLLKYPRPRYVSSARTINISLREDSGNWLYLNGGSIWHTLAAKETKATKVYVWLDAECPLTRRLLTEFRELYTGVPAEIAPKLTIGFPCDAEDGFWAWGEVEVQEQNACAGGGGWGRVERREAIVPRFKVVARGRQRFNETSCGYVSRGDLGRPRVRVLKAGNPFEDILLYGRGIHDDSYY